MTLHGSLCLDGNEAHTTFYFTRQKDVVQIDSFPLA